MEAAAHLGVPKRAINRSLARIVEAAEPWGERVSEIGFDDQTTDHMMTFIAERRMELHQPAA
ncbi:hypothetical protein [Nocardia sp. NPDC050175]|uniref:hypothetical protein n=1 Tax=Nocardia sp. NPDC050175 TaxID=3364317 RepID=UPI003795331C